MSSPRKASSDFPSLASSTFFICHRFFPHRYEWEERRRRESANSQNSCTFIFPLVSITPFFSYLIRSATLTLVRKISFITAHDTNELSLSHEILLMLICWIHPMIATTGDAASVYIELGSVCLLWETRARLLPHSTHTHVCSSSSSFNLSQRFRLKREVEKFPPRLMAPPFRKIFLWCAPQYKHTFMLKHILCFDSPLCMTAIREKSMLLLLWIVLLLFCKSWFCFFCSHHERGRGRAFSERQRFSLTEKYILTMGISKNNF